MPLWEAVSTVVGVALLAEAAVEPVREAGPRGFCTIGSDGSSTCSSSSLGSTPALRLGLKKEEIFGLAGELDLPCFTDLGFGPGFPLGRPEGEIQSLLTITAAAHLKVSGSVVSPPLGLALILVEEQTSPPVEGPRPAKKVTIIGLFT